MWHTSVESSSPYYVTDIINEVVVALEQLPGPIPPLDPPTSFTTEICRIFHNLSIYHWDNFSDKSECLIMVTLSLLEK